MNKRDIMLISVVLIIAIIFIFIKKISFKESNYAYVYYENKEILEIDLNINDTYIVNGYNGDVVIEVLNKKIRVKEENSPLHICSKQGFVSDSTPIICLPNKIVIKIEEKEELDTRIWGVYGYKKNSKNEYAFSYRSST